MIAPTCPKCRRIHTAGSVTAVGRFRHDGPLGYRVGGRTYETRAEAEAALCDGGRDAVEQGCETPALSSGYAGDPWDTRGTRKDGPGRCANTVIPRALPTAKESTGA